MPNKVLKTINYNGEDYDINAANADIASVAVMANGLAGDIVIDGIAANSGDSVVHYTICSTAGNAANKTISLDNFQLVNGARVTVKFTNSSTAVNPTLKVGTTAAKPIWYNGNAVDNKTILAGQVYEFVYDSSDQRWMIVGSASTVSGEIATYDVATTTSNGLMSSTDKSKLNTIERNAQVNVQSDWSETDTDSDAYIQNKPYIPSKLSDLTDDTALISDVKIGTSSIVSNRVATIPAATSSVNGYMTSTMAGKLNGIDAGAQVNVIEQIKVNDVGLPIMNKAVSLVLPTKLTDLENDLAVTDVQIATGSDTSESVVGNHVAIIPVATASKNGLMPSSAVSKLSGIEDNANNYSHPSYTARTGNPTANQTPGFGESFTVSQVKSNTLGHVTAMTNRTITIPSATASTTANGLMSSTDKTNFDILNQSKITIAGNEVSIKNGSVDAATLRTSLGLSTAMHFIGKATKEITDGSTADPGITGYSTKTAGDVVIDSATSYEYVWSGTAWERLGPDGSYALADHTHDTATSSTAGFMSATDKAKLAGITAGAEPNVQANWNTTNTDDDSFILNKPTALSDFTNDVAVTDVKMDTTSIVSNYVATIPSATASRNGYMTKEQAGKLAGIEANAQVNTVTGVKGSSESTYRTGNINITKANLGLGNVENKSSATIRSELTADNVADALGYTPASNSAATASANGLMTSTMVSKLTGIAAGAEVNVQADWSETDTTSDAYIKNKPSVPTQLSDLVDDSTLVTDVKLGTTSIVKNRVATIPAATSSANGYMSSTQVSTLTNLSNSAITSITVNSPILKTDGTNSVTLSHAAPSTLTPNQYYGQADTTTISDEQTVAPEFGGSFKMPEFYVDQFGHLTQAATYKVVIPSNVATASASGLMSSEDKGKLTGIATGAQVNVIESVKVNNTALTITNKAVNVVVPTKLSDLTNDIAITAIKLGDSSTALTPATSGNTRTVTIPLATASANGLMTSTMVSNLTTINNDYISSIGTTTGTPLTVSRTIHTISLSHDAVFTSAPGSFGDSDDQTPSFGGTFKALRTTVNKFGHVTAISEHTITIPDAVATVSANGLMSSSDKAKLDGFEPANSYATVTDVSRLIADVAGALVFKGIVNSNSDLPANPENGWTYRVGTAGTYDGKTCEVGDILIYTTSSGWVRAQANRDGALFIGSNTITDGSLLAADGVIGQVKSVELTSTSINNLSVSVVNEVLTFKTTSQTVVTGVE